ncbi:MAG: RHS repeat-associated core domain-containing protein [bacterium]
MAEGFYDLRVVATDDRGNRTTAGRLIELAPGAGFGRMRRVFLDARTPLVGIPIEIRRIYDSGRKAPGDFGVAWTLDIGAGRYEETNPAGEGWSWNGRCVGIFGPPPSISETQKHIITILLGDEGYRFYVNVIFQACGGGFQEAVVEFEPLPGTDATLTPLQDNLVWLIGDQFFEAGTIDPWEPTRFRLDLADGRSVIYDIHEGVERVDDGDGHALTIDAQGVHHSSGVSITRVRDAQGRITTLRLPDGAERTYLYDAQGDLIQTTDFRDGETFYRYDFQHNLLRIVDPRGNVPLSMEYDETGRVAAYVDGNGNRLAVDHDPAGRQEVQTDRRGNVTIYSYDAQGNVTEIIDPLGGRTLYTYDADGNLLTETDPLGHVTRNTYDANGNRTEKIDPTGERWTWAYDADGNVLQAVDPEGNVTAYTYDAGGRRTSETDATGAVTAWAYDANGNNTRVTDGEGNATTLAWSGTGGLTQIVDPGGTTFALTPDPANGNITREVHTLQTRAGPRAVEWRYGFDRDGELLGITGPDGQVSSFERDAAGQAIGATDPAGGATALTLDAFGRIRERRTPDGAALRVDYDAEGNETAVTLPGAVRLEREYDALNRLVAVRSPEGGTVAQTFDAAGRVTRRTSALGAAIDYAYDAAGRLSTITLPGGAVTTYERDRAGRVTAMVDAEGSRWTFDQDGEGRITRAAAGGRRAAHHLRRQRQPTSIVEATGAARQLEWSATGELIRVTDSAGGITTYGRDSHGSLDRVTDALGRITDFVFDPTGRLLERHLPLGQVERITYDSRGLPATHTDFLGGITRFFHDAGGHLERMELSDGTAVRHTLDAGGRDLAVADRRGTTRFGRDVRGREVRWEGPEGDVLTRAFDLDGRITEVGTAAGVTQYAYNDRSELTRIEDPDGRVFTLTRDRLGRPLVVSLPDGSTLTRTFDGLGRLTHLLHQEGDGSTRAELLYTYDVGGHITRIAEDDGRVVDYAYDALDRLVEETITEPGQAPETLRYAYDAVGNLVQREDAGGTRDFTYDANDRLIDDDRFTYTWDDNGRVIGRQGPGVDETWRYDGLGRLVAVERDGLPTIEYDYDVDGMLAGRRVGADGQRYLWDRGRGLPLLAEVRDAADDSLITRYVHGAGGLLAQIQGDGALDVLTPDHLGTVRASSRGGVTTRHRYEAYGAPRAGGDLLGYTGAYTDPDTGMLFLRARWYAPAMARFITTDADAGDPADPRTINRYAYGFGDPIGHSDPTGHFSVISVSVALTIVSVLANIAFTMWPSALDFIFSGLGAFSALRFSNQTAVVFPFASLGANRGIIGATFGLELLRFNGGIWALYFYFGLSLTTAASTGISGSLNVAIGVIYDTPAPTNYTGWFIAITAGGAKLANALARKVKRLPANIRPASSCTIFWSPSATFTEGDGTNRFSHGFSCAAHSFSFGGTPGPLKNSLAISFTYYIKLLEMGHQPGDEYQNLDFGF